MSVMNWMFSANLILFCCAIGYSQSISPSNSDSSNEYYVISEYNTLPEENYLIDCATDINCYVNCDTQYGCQNATIDASSATSLTLRCINQYACYKGTIIYGAKFQTNIHCKDNQACASADFSISNSENVYIECNCTTTYCENVYDINAQQYTSPCGFATFDAKNCKNVVVYTRQHGTKDTVFDVSYVSNYVDFTADGDFGLQANITGYYMDGKNLTINCIYPGSCAKSHIFCPLAEYNTQCILNDYAHACCSDRFWLHFENRFYDNFELNCLTGCTWIGHIDVQCDDTGKSSIIGIPSLYNGTEYECTRYGCCPVHDSMNIICEADQPCNVNCGTGDCIYGNIDGSLASSLTVSCYFSQDCEHANIKCPLQDDTSCYINCYDPQSCFDMNIKLGAARMDTFQLNCAEYLSCTSYNPCCDGGFIIAPIFSNTVYIKTLKIKCVKGACDDTHFDFNAFNGNIGTVFYEPDESDFLLSNAIINEWFHYEGIHSSWRNILQIVLGYNAIADIMCYTPKNSTLTDVATCAGKYFFISSEPLLKSIGATVNIYCMDDDSCDNTEFTFTNVNVTMYCNKKESCFYGIIYATEADYLKLYCGKDTDSCGNLNIYCPYVYKDSCSIICNDEYNTSCNDMNVIVPEYYRYGFLSFEWTQQFKSINKNIIRFSCNNQYAPYDLRYDKKFSDWNHPFKWIGGGNDYIFDDNTMSDSCNETDFSWCCPWMTNKEIYCIDDICEIKCDQDICVNKLIDGSSATSLTVTCNNCTDLTILCPEIDDGICNIECINDLAYGFSCYNIAIGVYYGYDTLYSYSLSITCDGKGNFQRGNGANACHFIQIYATYVGDINFHCISGLCDEIVMYGDYANNILLECDIKSQCYDIFIMGTYVSNSIKINSFGPYTLQDGGIYAINASSVTITCSSDSDIEWQGSCVNNRWYLPLSEVTINCFGFGCKYGSQLYLQSNDASYININVNGCNACYEWSDKCFHGEWTLVCNRTLKENNGLGYDTYDSVDFFSDYCENINLNNGFPENDNDCGCLNLLTKTENGFVNDESNNNCLFANVTQPPETTMEEDDDTDSVSVYGWLFVSLLMYFILQIFMY